MIDTPAPPDGAAARLIIDRDAMARNFNRLRALAPSAETASVVKADAYGLGAAALAPRLAREGCRSFFVASVEEGAALRRALGEGEAEIWVFNGYRAEERDAFVAHRLSPVLNHPGELAAFAEAPAGACALHLDTGMNRLGFSPAEAEALIAASDRLDDLDVRLIMSHLSSSEDVGSPMNDAQRQRFAALAARLPRARLSLANTGGILLGEAFHFDLTRPGGGLYGVFPDPDADPGLEPVVRLEAPILQVRSLTPGDTVGYGATYVADRPRLAATVAAGYADGLPRTLSSAGYARIAGTPAPILGRVSMDLITLDVTGLDRAIADGAPAVFLGQDIAPLAKAAGLLPYELLTGLGHRPRRIYEGAP